MDMAIVSNEQGRKPDTEADVLEGLPDRFIERYSSLVDDPASFFQSLARPLRKSFRVNRLKAEPALIKERFDGYGIGLESVSWCPDAFICDSLDCGSTLEHFLGRIYIQELASMVPPLLMAKEIEKAGSVLDACAAPGSKTTQICSMMDNQGIIIANDLDYGRIRALKFNLERCGALNTAITNFDIKRMPFMEFDAVFVDAPCSAEGTMRKSYSALRQWNERRIRGNSSNQKVIASRCFDMLRPGGAMLYSTCTFAPEENEEVIDHLIREKGAKVLRAPLPGLRTAQGISSWQGKEYDPQVRSCARILPHHNDTGGFFMAKVSR